MSNDLACCKTAETKCSKEAGSTMVEFALVLVPLTAFLFIALDLGWVLFAWASLQEAVREGTRFAVTGTTGSFTCQDAAIQSVVQKYSFGFVNAGNVNTAVSIQYYSPANLGVQVVGVNSNRGGNVVKIVAKNVTVSPFLPLWRSSSPITLAASASDIVEGSPTNTPPCR